MRLKDIVSKDPNVHSGDLVFAGTRVPAVRLVSYLQKGYSLNEFIKQFPSVHHRQAQAFLELGLDRVEELVEQQEENVHARIA